MYNSIEEAFAPYKEIQIPDGETKNFAIRNYELTEKDIARILLRERINPHRRPENYGIQAGKYIKLVEKREGYNESWWETMMSNTPMEMHTNMEFLQKAHGHVLIAGLGIGLILVPVQRKEEVKTVTVVEKEEEIIGLVAKHLNLNSKVSIICQDIYQFRPTVKFDTIYIDILNFVTSDNKDSMMMLKKQLRKNLNRKDPEHWIGIWRERELRRYS